MIESLTEEEIVDYSSYKIYTMKSGDVVYWWVDGNLLQHWSLLDPPTNVVLLKGVVQNQRMYIV